MQIEALQELAKIIKLSQELREASYVQPTVSTPCAIRYYTSSLYESALEAAAQTLSLPHEHVIVAGTAQLVYLLNNTAWNDIQAWSTDIINYKSEEESK